MACSNRCENTGRNVLVDDNLGKRALALLRKSAMKRARNGEQWPRFVTTGDLMRQLELGQRWETNTKAYRELQKALRHGANMGLIESSTGRSPVAYRYVGKEVDDALEAAEQAKLKKLDDLGKALRALGIRKFELNEYCDGLYVSFKAAHISKLTERLKS